jgi:hypothetical protein
MAGAKRTIDQAIRQNPEMRIMTIGNGFKAIVLNGLGFVNQQLYLVSSCVAVLSKQAHSPADYLWD